MALYAIDDDDLIQATDARSDKIYWCLDCFGPVKQRKGRKNFAHFYHLKTTPSCRLFSKSEDHLVGQTELQRRFPKGELQIEKSFMKIGRVADACWEKEKMIFEIQCSPINEKEVEGRMNDYESVGYDVVWLLDDKRFNKRTCSQAEQFLRERSCYYLSIRDGRIYDQFEYFSGVKRIRKGKPLPIDLNKVYRTRFKKFDEKTFPQQIVRLKCRRYFYGDRLSRALHFPLAMKHEKEFELKLAKKPNPFITAFKKYIFHPYVRWLEDRIRGR